MKITSSNAGGYACAPPPLSESDFENRYSVYRHKVADTAVRTFPDTIQSLEIRALLRASNKTHSGEVSRSVVQTLSGIAQNLPDAPLLVCVRLDQLVARVAASEMKMENVE